MNTPAVPMLQVRQLTTALGARGPEILSSVDLSLGSGEVLGVVGESGSGKSMLALSIMGLLPQPIMVRSGQVHLQGQDLLALPPRQMRALRGKDVAMIFQEPMTSLNPVMRVGQQIGEVLRWHLSLQGDAARAEGIALLRRVEMPDPQRQIDAYPHELSGGMRQRVMIAMALAGRPRLLIADEPTTALDVTIQSQILNLLRKLQQDSGMSVLLITHDLGVIAEMCDRVAVMYAGRVVEQGAVLDIFDRPTHPYTRGLLASRPKISAGAQWLSTIDGTVPALGQMGPGCSFAPRCPLARTACTSVPALREVGPGHQAACVVPFETTVAA
jgi:oligopeptide/dipeptide ABC transporter ATP-binding protein